MRLNVLPLMDAIEAYIRKANDDLEQTLADEGYTAPAEAVAAINRIEDSVAAVYDEQIGELLKQVTPQDFVKYGLIPEFVGRLPITVTLDLLNKEALVRILTETKSAICKQYKKLFELDGVELEFDEDALYAIAEEAMERKTGARGLRSIIEKATLDLMYEIPEADKEETFSKK